MTRRSDLTRELYYILKSFKEFHAGWRYIVNRYVKARAIFNAQPFERPENNPDLSVHMLVGHRDSLAALWALLSWYSTSQEIGRLYLHDDGSLTAKDRQRFERLMPHVQWIQSTDVLRHLALAPAHDRLKKIRSHVDQFVLIRKLIDPYIISDRPLRLIIDSDVLWFRRPIEIDTAIQQGCSQSYMMTNLSPSRVYFTDGTALDDAPALYNSGIVAYHRDHFNLDRLYAFCEKIDYADPRNGHFIEQAGYGVCLDHPAGLPVERYHIKGVVTEQTIVKHYTSPRRPLLYTEGLPLLRAQLLVQS